MMRPDIPVEQRTELIVEIINTAMCEFEREYPDFVMEINSNPDFEYSYKMQLFGSYMDNTLNDVVDHLDAKAEIICGYGHSWDWGFDDIISCLDYTVLEKVYEELKRFIRKAKVEMKHFEVLTYHHTVSKLAAQLNEMGYFDDLIIQDKYGNRRL